MGKFIIDEVHVEFIASLLKSAIKELPEGTPERIEEYKSGLDILEYLDQL